MYSLKEMDLMPGSTCEFVATGATKDEVNQMMMAHAKEVHADQFTQMTPEQTEATMKRADELLSAQDPQGQPMPDVSPSQSMPESPEGQAMPGQPS